MNFFAFLRDRRLYILLYLAFGFLTVAVVQLDLSLSGARLRFANILYLFLLGTIGLVVFLAVDYRRQRAFFRRVEKILAADALDALAVLDEPVTLEQRLYAEAWQRLYARMRSELAAAEERGRNRVNFLSQWAHHMKTPVAVIDLELQKARESGVADPEAFLRSIAEENERIRLALQALLNRIRLDAFAADFKVEEVELLSLVREVVNAHRRMFITHGVYPKILPPPGDPAGERRVVTDAKWLRFILEQILSNAVKYSARPERDGRVVIRLDDTGEELVLEVADNGIGIPPEDLPRVFQPFYTGTAGRAYAPSTGLGLYLAHEACRRLGHSLTLDSKPGEGTRVRIAFQRDPSLHAELRDVQKR